MRVPSFNRIGSSCIPAAIDSAVVQNYCQPALPCNTATTANEISAQGNQLFLFIRMARIGTQEVGSESLVNDLAVIG